MRRARAGCGARWAGVRYSQRQGGWRMAEYQIVSLEEVDDWLGDYPGEMRGITYAIGAEQVALTYRRMPQHTGSKGSYWLIVSARIDDPSADGERPDEDFWPQ